MNKRTFIFLLVLLAVSLSILLLIFLRIDPYTLSEKELLFFLFWCFCFLFPLSAIFETFIYRSFLRRDFALKLILRRAFFVSFYFTLLLALQIFRAFSILGAILLALFFILIDFYFKS